MAVRPKKLAETISKNSKTLKAPNFEKAKESIFGKKFCCE